MTISVEKFKADLAKRNAGDDSYQVVRMQRDNALKDCDRWMSEAENLRKARNGWRLAFCAALLLGTIAGVVLGFAIAQGVL